MCSTHCFGSGVCYVFLHNPFSVTQVVKRVTLHRLMPDLGSTLSQLFTKLEIQEPTFTDLVLLYRKSKSVLDRSGSDKDQLPNWSKVHDAFSAVIWKHVLGL